MSKKPYSGSILSSPLKWSFARNMRITNYRGEVSERQIKALSLWFGSTQYHPEPQWILTAIDVERDVIRDFALKDMVLL